MKTSNILALFTLSLTVRGWISMQLSEILSPILFSIASALCSAEMDSDPLYAIHPFPWKSDKAGARARILEQEETISMIENMFEKLKDSQTGDVNLNKELSEESFNIIQDRINKSK